jgi:hypothetical protein
MALWCKRCYDGGNENVGKNRKEEEEEESAKGSRSRIWIFIVFTISEMGHGRSAEINWSAQVSSASGALVAIGRWTNIP